METRHIFKDGIKYILKKTGLFSFAVEVYHIKYKVTNFRRNFTSFFVSLKLYVVALNFYIYNEWITFFPFHIVRIFYLRNFLNIKIGKYSFMHMGVRFEGKISIGTHTVIGRNCVLKGDILIKDNVSITAETYIFTSSHLINDPYFSCFYTRVIIEDYAWIGARAMIMPGVTIGKGAVLGAVSMANRDIPDYEIYVGSPAKRIGSRSSELKYELNYFPFFQ